MADFASGVILFDSQQVNVYGATLRTPARSGCERQRSSLVLQR